MEEYDSYIQQYKGDVKWGSIYNSGMVIDVQLLARLMDKFESRINEKFLTSTEKIAGEVFSSQKHMLEIGNTMSMFQDKLMELEGKMKELGKEVEQMSKKREDDTAKLLEVIQSLSQKIQSQYEKSQIQNEKSQSEKPDPIAKKKISNFKKAVQQKLLNDDLPQANKGDDLKAKESNEKTENKSNETTGDVPKSNGTAQDDSNTDENHKKALEIMHKVCSEDASAKNGNETTVTGNLGSGSFGNHRRGRNLTGPALTKNDRNSEIQQYVPPKQRNTSSAHSYNTKLDGPWRGAQDRQEFPVKQGGGKVARIGNFASDVSHLGRTFTNIRQPPENIISNPRGAKGNNYNETIGKKEYKQKGPRKSSSENGEIEPPKCNRKKCDPEPVQSDGGW